MKPTPTLSPQQYLDAFIRSRGYSAEQHPVLPCAYHNNPSPLQIASYGVHVVNLINVGNCDALDELMKVGLSPNACNVHGESILNHVCRRVDNVRMLDVLLEAGCVIQTSDQNGRTPLHHACWAVTPNFPMVEKILQRDIRLLYMADSHGNLPLSYIRPEHWSEWLHFFQARREIYWPRTASGANSAAPPLAYVKPHARIIRDPDHALPIDLAKMVSSGKLRIKEAKFLMKTFDHVVSDRPFLNLNFEEEEYDHDYDDTSSYLDDFSSSTSTYDDGDYDDDDEEEGSVDDQSSYNSTDSDTLSESKTTSHSDDDDEDDNYDNDSSDSDEQNLEEENELDTESWYERKKKLQALSSPMQRPIEW